MEMKSLPTYEEVQKLFDDYVEKKAAFPSIAHMDTSESSSNLSIPATEKNPAVSAFDELMALTGLDKVKDAVKCEINYHRIMRLRRQAGRKTPKRLMNILLTGNPGTGKTTVARLIGKIFKEEGILHRGHCIETSRAHIVGKWIGETEQKTSELIDSARGGILFIDEIYNLVESDSNQISQRDFGMKAIDTLMPILSNPDSDVIVIGAGYTSSIKTFLQANPGLASRFPLVLEFEDFSVEQLMEIAGNELHKHDFTLSPEAETGLKNLLTEAVKVKNHGNARLVMTILDNHIIPNLCNRLAKNTDLDSIDIDLTGLILPEDLPSLRALFPLHDIKRRAIGFNH